MVLFWILLIGVACGVGLRVYLSDRRSGDDVFGALLVAFLPTLASSAVVAFGVGWIVAEFAAPETVIEEKVEEWKLVSALDANVTESSYSGAFLFVVGGASGGSETNLEYAWFEKDESGAIEARTGITPDYDTEVKIYFIKEGERPRVTRTTEEASRESPSWVAPMDLAPNRGESDDEVWSLYVPRSAIVRDFAFDLK